MNGIGRFTPYLVIALGCLANGRAAGMGGLISGSLNPHGVSSSYEMRIDFRSTATDLLKKAHIIDGSQTVLSQTGFCWTVGTPILRNTVGYHNSCFTRLQAYNYY